MKRKSIFMAVAVLIGATAINNNLFPILAGDIVTIIGEVIETNEIVVYGEIYEVEGTPEGDDLVKNYIHQKVKVNDTLSENPEKKKRAKMSQMPEDMY